MKHDAITVQILTDRICTAGQAYILQNLQVQLMPGKQQYPLFQWLHANTGISSEAVWKLILVCMDSRGV